MIAFTIFGVSIYRYGIFYALTFILGYFGLLRIGKKGWFKLYSNVQYFLTEGLEEFLFIIALGIIFGGRLGHILIYNNGYYFEHPIEILQIWKGGMSFIGGILGVILSLGGYLFYRKVSLKEILILFDLILIFVPLGIFLGRFGNYLNQELFGIPISTLPTGLSHILTTLGFCHIYTKIDQIPRINTNFLSMFFEGGVLFILQLITFAKMIKEKKYNIGQLSTNFLLYYSLIRFFLEYLRADSQFEFVGLYTKSQRFFLSFFILTILLKVYLNRGSEDYLFLPKK